MLGRKEGVLEVEGSGVAGRDDDSTRREWGGGSGWVGGEVLQNTQMAKQERF